MEDIDTSGLNLSGNALHIIRDILFLHHCLKAAILESIDNVLKFVSTTESFTDILAERGQTPYHFLKYCFERFEQHFKIRFCSVSVGRTDLPDFEAIRTAGASSSTDKEEHTDRMVIIMDHSSGCGAATIQQNWTAAGAVKI